MNSLELKDLSLLFNASLDLRAWEKSHDNHPNLDS